MINPVVIVGGAALALWLLLSGKSTGEEVPATPPPPPPPPQNKPVIDEAGKTYTASETQKWYDEGYAIGYAHGAGGLSMNPTATIRYPDSDAQQVLYEQYYSEGYRVGYNLGVAEFSSVDPSATKPSIEGSFGSQPKKSAGNSGPVIDYTSTRGNGSRITRSWR